MARTLSKASFAPPTAMRQSDERYASPSPDMTRPLCGGARLGQPEQSSFALAYLGRATPQAHGHMVLWRSLSGILLPRQGWGFSAEREALRISRRNFMARHAATGFGSNARQYMIVGKSRHPEHEMAFHLRRARTIRRTCLQASTAAAIVGHSSSLSAMFPTVDINLRANADLKAEHHEPLHVRSGRFIDLSAVRPRRRKPILRCGC